MSNRLNLQLELLGHQEFYNLQDILRLFYGISTINETSLNVDLPANSRLLQSAAAQNEKVVIISQVNAGRENLSSPTCLTEILFQNETFKQVSTVLKIGDKISEKLQAQKKELNFQWSELINYYEQQKNKALIEQEIEQHLLFNLLQVSRLLKKQLYDLLCLIENLRFPWGSLTGIRPTYIAGEIYQTIYNWRQLWQAKLQGKKSVSGLFAEENERTKEYYMQLSTLCNKPDFTESDFKQLSSLRLPLKAYNDSKLWQLTEKYLQVIYNLSSDKAALVTLTACNENRLLESSLQKSYGRHEGKQLSVYIGIPFCFTRCAYCSFAPRDGIKAETKLITDYITSLIEEISRLWPLIHGNIQTLYIGGGTPSALDENNLKRLLEFLQTLPNFQNIAEKTFEAGRADTITAAKLKIVRQAGFNHICVNPQTFNPETLKHLGRPAYADDILQVMQLVKAEKFPVCNMDLIFGLPGEKAQDMLHSLDCAMKLNPENITIHTLAFKRKSWLGQLRQAEKSVPDNIRNDSLLRTFAGNLNQLEFVQSELHKTLTTAQNTLIRAGYLPYYMYRQKDAVSALENTGFAKIRSAAEAESLVMGNLYNVLMMLDQTSVLGFGCCAMSKFVSNGKVERFSNARSVASYLANSREHSCEKAVLLQKFFQHD